MDLASEVTYRETENTIYQLCWKAQKRWGGEFDDYLSSANVAWVNAYQKFDFSRGVKFNTYVYRAIWNALLDEYSSQVKWVKNNKSMPEEVEFAEKHSRFTSLMSDMSEDARIIIQLVLEAPSDLRDLLSAKQPQQSRQNLWAYLRGLGWSMARTVDAFSELKEAAV